MIKPEDPRELPGAGGKLPHEGFAICFQNGKKKNLSPAKLIFPVAEVT
jgi:hypothetical protein